MPRIVLSTLNARYIHASLGLRYLKANMEELDDDTALIEFTINQNAETIVESLLSQNPEIVGFGVYIWNTVETQRVIALLKTIKPELIIVLGGPEISYEYEDQQLFQLTDYLITGPADLAFTRLCRELIAGKRPACKVIAAHPEPLPMISLPYYLYDDEDIRHRVLYVEASRGCPFKCEFCLSSLDKTAWPFDQALFLNEMQILFDRGARHFKFVDRTFNLKISASISIMEFFLEKLKTTELFLHFELIPDRLPEPLKAMLPRFPEGSIQFEIGVQTFNPDVQGLISRKQDNEKTVENLKWIRQNTTAHIHADLIFGLPGESLQSFAEGFDKLYQLNPHEIQLGMLKRLRGTPIARHTESFDMRYNPLAPYTVLSTSTVDFGLMQKIARFARYWNLIANSGRFNQSLPLLMGEQPFDNFYRLSEHIYKSCGQTHKIALRKLFDHLYNAMTQSLGLDEQIVLEALEHDFSSSGQKGWFTVPNSDKNTQSNPDKATLKSRQRQSRHA